MYAKLSVDCVLCGYSSSSCVGVGGVRVAVWAATSVGGFVCVAGGCVSRAAVLQPYVGRDVQGSVIRVGAGRQLAVQ